MHDAQLSGTVQTYYTVFLLNCQVPDGIVEKNEIFLEKRGNVCYNDIGDDLGRDNTS